MTEQLSSVMKEAGFIWDPARGYARWTHLATGVTALRQPYLSDEQWGKHQQQKIEEARRGK
jgi:hypothetical protein